MSYQRNKPREEADRLILSGSVANTNIDEPSNPWALGSVAIPFAFATSGWLNQVYSTPLLYYMYDVIDIETQQYYLYKSLTISTVLMQPVFGLLCEVWPTNGARYKHLMAGGALFAVVCLLCLVAIPHPTYTHVLWLAFGTHLGSNAMSAASYMLVQERSSFERAEDRGRFQTTCLIANSIGAVLGQALSVLYSHTLSEFDLGWSWGGLSLNYIFLLAAAMPAIFVVPFTWPLQEEVSEPSGLVTETRKLFDVLSQSYVFVPIVGMTGVKFLTTDNSAAATMLLDGCGVSELEYTGMVLSQMVVAWLANLMYRSKLFKWDFRTVYALSVGLSILTRFNDLPGVFFFGKEAVPCLLYLGLDSVMSDWASYTAIAVHSVLIVLMCDGERNGKQNLMLSSMITAGWDLMSISVDYYSDWFNVGTEEISKHDYDGFYALQALCAGLTCLAVFMLPLIPRDRESFLNTIRLERKTEEHKSYKAALLLCLWWFFAVVFTISFAANEDWFLNNDR